MFTNGRSLMYGSVALIVGTAVGAGLGIVAAPQSGVQTRRRLRGLMGEIEERAGQLADDTKIAVTRVVDRSKRLVA